MKKQLRIDLTKLALVSVICARRAGWRTCRWKTCAWWVWHTVSGAFDLGLM